MPVTMPERYCTPVPEANAGRYRPAMGALLRWFFFASLSVILLVQLRGIDAALLSPDTPYGIVGYELAFTVARAQAMLNVWRSMDVLETVRVSLGVDMAFLLAYPWFFRTSIQLLRRFVVPRQAVSLNHAGAFDQVGQWAALAVLACTPLDMTENLVLWRMLETQPSPFGTLLAGLAASIKFLLVLVAGGWCLVAIARSLFTRWMHA